MCATGSNYLAGHRREPAEVGDNNGEQQDGGGGGGGRGGEGDDEEEDGEWCWHRPQPPHHLDLPAQDEGPQQ